LLVGLVVSLLGAAILYVGRLLLGLLGLVEATASVPLWVAAVLLGLVGAGSLALAGRLGARTQDVEAYDTYAEHIRDALSDLRRVVGGELPGFSLRDFAENGLFQPAQRLLGRNGRRGDLRFSVLHPSGDQFVMANDRTLFPALGHSLEGRQAFQLPMAGSFSSLAYQHGRVFASNHLTADDRYEPHPQARPGRGYESIISVPLRERGIVDGVFNVVATNREAFTLVDGTYVTLLGSVLDVARTIVSVSELGDVTTVVPATEPPRLPPGTSSD
jgi:hypothetical protein